MGKIPKVILTSQIDLGGFIMHVHQLDNGQRVIDAEDVERFFTSPDIKVTPEQADKLANAIRKGSLTKVDDE